MGQNKYVRVLNPGHSHYNNDIRVGKWCRIEGGNRDEWQLLDMEVGEHFYANRGDCSEVLTYGELADYVTQSTKEIQEVAEENYKRKETHYELWEDFDALTVMEATLSHVEFIGFLKGNILKYQLRLGNKTGESIEKDRQKINTYKQILKECHNL